MFPASATLSALAFKIVLNMSLGGAKVDCFSFGKAWHSASPYVLVDWHEWSSYLSALERFEILAPAGIADNGAQSYRLNPDIFKIKEL